MKRAGLYFLFALLFITMLFIFRPSSNVQQDLLKAEELMIEYPDSCLQVLGEIDNRYLSGENKALYALLMTQAKFKNRQPVNSDSLINIAVDYYKNRGDSLRKAQSYYYKGRIEENINNPKEALAYYQQALVAASSINNYNLSGLVCYYWGLLLQKKYLFDDALPIFQKSLSCSKKDNDTIRQIFVLKEMGKNYSWNKKYAKALDYYNSALKLSLLMGNKERIAEICNNLGLLFKHKQEYDSAIYYVNKSVLLGSDSVLIFSGFLMKGDLFTLQHRYDSARYYLNKGGKSDNLTSKATYCFLMSVLEEKSGNYKDAFSYSNQYINYIDSVVVSTKEKEIFELQKKYDYSLMKNKNHKLELEKKNREIAILFFAIILIIAIWGLTHRYKKIRREKDVLAKASQEQLEQMTDKLVRWEVELDKFQQKSKADLAEIREWVLSRNEFIKKIKNLNEMSTSKKIANAETMRLTDKDIENLREVMNICFDNFEVRLVERFPKLKDEYVQFCCLLKMKVPISTISILVNIDEASLIKRKYRLKKNQMGLAEGYSSLDDFLLKF